MDSREIEGLSHWSFIKLFEEHYSIYISMYDEALSSIKLAMSIYKFPSNITIELLENAVKAILVEEQFFSFHCRSKNSYNIEWNLKCLESFSKYIVSKSHG